jgi:hypothetical protein
MANYLPQRWLRQPAGYVDLAPEFEYLFAQKVGHAYLPWLRKFNRGIIEANSGTGTLSSPIATPYGVGLGSPRIGGTVVSGLQVGTTQAPATSTYNVVFMFCQSVSVLGGTVSYQWQSGESGTAIRHSANINFDAGTAYWTARSSQFAGIGNATFTLPTEAVQKGYAAVALVHDYTANETFAFCNGVEMANTAYTNTGGGWFGGWINIWGAMPTFGVVYPCLLGWRTTARMSRETLRELTVNPWQIFRPQTARIYSFPSGSTGVTGTASPTNAADTSTAAGTVGTVGSGTPTNAADTASASGTVATTGAGAPTNAADTAAGVGARGHAGTGTQANADDTADASGTVGAGSITGTGSPTNAADTGTAAGTVGTVGTAAATNGADTATAAGTVGHVGAGTPTNEADTASGSGTAGTVVPAVTSAGGGRSKKRRRVMVNGRLYNVTNDELQALLAKLKDDAATQAAVAEALGDDELASEIKRKVVRLAKRVEKVDERAEKLRLLRNEDEQILSLFIDLLAA